MTVSRHLVISFSLLLLLQDYMCGIIVVLRLACALLEVYAFD